MPKAPALRLLNDQVLVQPLRKYERFESKNPGGLLFLPDNPQRDRQMEFFWWGRVVLIGLGDKYRYRRKLGPHDERFAYQHATGRFPMDTQPGDIVLYERRPWGDVTLEGHEYTIIHEEQHIAGVLSHADGWADSAKALRPGDRWTADLENGEVLSGVVPMERAA
jgi:co-chaperonin GroES (HSP10)